MKYFTVLSVLNHNCQQFAQSAKTLCHSISIWHKLKYSHIKTLPKMLTEELKIEKWCWKTFLRLIVITALSAFCNILCFSLDIKLRGKILRFFPLITEWQDPPIMQRLRMRERERETRRERITEKSKHVLLWNLLLHIYAPCLSQSQCAAATRPPGQWGWGGDV